MAQTKIGICNIALAMIGAAPIRAFDENNKRSRMADTFFETVRDYLLSRYDWPFARAYLVLQPVVLDSTQIPEGLYPYKLPSDCRTPRELASPGSKEPWEIIGPNLFCRAPSEVGAKLYYTRTNVDASTYSDTFVSILALGMASYMAMPIAQDKALAKDITERYAVEQREAFESDANIGNNYRDPDERPENDTFVNPGGWQTPAYNVPENR